MSKFAVVVGCNYPGGKRPLRGCTNDALAIRDMLTALSGYKPNDIKLLTDDTPIQPTGANIKQALDEMFNKAQPDDQLFFYFSGHGTYPSKLCNDEAIVCSDNNLITKYEFRELVNRLPGRASSRMIPERASFQMVVDSCNSGGLIDKEKEQIGPSSTSTTQRSRTGTIPLDSRCKAMPFESIIESLCDSTGDRTSNVNALMVQAFGDQASLRFRQSEDELLSSRLLGPDDGILISACQPNELAWEVPYKGKFYGAFTLALTQMAQSEEAAFGCSNEMVVKEVTKVLERLGLEDLGMEEQHPCLYCSDLNTELCFVPIRLLPRYLRALSQIIKWGLKLFNNIQYNRK